MALGSPSIGTSSNWYSQYETDVSNLLQRVLDNSSNLVSAKDVRDSIWTLYNQIQSVSEQSLTQSSLYTLGTPSTATIGGITEGSTFSNADLQELFDRLLLPYVAPSVTYFNSSISELQFGQSTPLSLTYNINVGSVPIFSIGFIGPYLPISSNTPTGLDPDIGTRSSIVPTYSNTSSISQVNTFTMSIVTDDLLSFSSTCSLAYHHKKYYGSLVIPAGFTPSIPSSVTTVRSFLTDSVIKGLSYSELSINYDIDRDISFATGSYFVFAAPTIFGGLPDDGFYVENIFTNDFTKIKDSYTFSNEYSYLTLYDVWISNNTYGEVVAKIST